MGAIAGARQPRSRCRRPRPRSSPQVQARARPRQVGGGGRAMGGRGAAIPPRASATHACPPLAPPRRRVRCETSAAMVPKDKAVKRFVVRRWRAAGGRGSCRRRTARAPAAHPHPLTARCATLWTPLRCATWWRPAPLRVRGGGGAGGRGSVAARLRAAACDCPAPSRSPPAVPSPSLPRLPRNQSMDQRWRCPSCTARCTTASVLPSTRASCACVRARTAATASPPASSGQCMRSVRGCLCGPVRVCPGVGWNGSPPLPPAPARPPPPPPHPPTIAQGSAPPDRRPQRRRRLWGRRRVCQRSPSGVRGREGARLAAAVGCRWRVAGASSLARTDACIHALCLLHACLVPGAAGARGGC